MIRLPISFVRRMSDNPQTVATVVESLTATKYSWVASLAFLLYDHVITLNVEVVNVWNRPRSLSRWLFIWTRYFGLVSLTMTVTVQVLFHGSLSNKVCKFFVWWEAISIALITASVEVILIIRVYAVYDCNKRILYGVVALFLLLLITTGILWGFTGKVPDINILPSLGTHPIDSIAGCFAPTTNLLGLSFVPAILNEVILCLFMLYQAWITYKNNHGSRLLKILIRDSVLYFSSISVTLLLNCLVTIFDPPFLRQIGFGWAYAVPCTMGSRLLLSMLQQASRDLESTSAF
ncbi:hypothetical protein JB92DRAFT_3098798 [Gautieria morchelliformis]|nr:hypothetical protein JB92DRAFT_3098798 [Gautieria morchelliformis]